VAKGKLFEYAVLYHPKQKKNAAGEVVEEKKSEVVVEPKRVVAITNEEVAMLAARDIPQDLTDKLDCVEIVVRPF
jgi:hypothetical protein